MIQHFIWQKVTVQDTQMEHIKIPRTTLKTGVDERWCSVAEKAVLRLASKSNLKQDEIHSQGLVSKLDYSAGSRDIYFMTYTTNGWLCKRAADSFPQMPLVQAPDNVIISFEPFVKFIKNDEICLFTTATSRCVEPDNLGSHLNDFHFIKTSLNESGEIEWIPPSEDDMNSVTFQAISDQVGMVKIGAMKTMFEYKKHWSNCLSYLIFRIDMSIDKKGEIGERGKGYLNEVEVFPNCWTFLVNSKKDLNHVINFARWTEMYITEHQKVGQYFCL